MSCTGGTFPPIGAVTSFVHATAGARASHLPFSIVANDSGRPVPNVVSDRALGAVRDALVRSLQASAEPTEEVRSALNALAREARERGVPPEQLLVVLKRIMHDLPEIRDAEPPADQASTLQRVVTLCIKEYFSD